MANIYVRSTDGNDADDGSTWTLAKATLTGAAAIDAAGDTIFVSQAHAESTAAAITFALAGTVASPTRIICGSDAAEPPTTVSALATVTTTGASNININGACYVDGFSFNTGTSIGGAQLYMHNTTSVDVVQLYRNCNFRLNNTQASNTIQMGSFSSSNACKSTYRWENCAVKFGAATHYIGACNFTWLGGSIESGSSALTTGLIRTVAASARDVSVLIDSVDLTNLGVTGILVQAANAIGKIVFRNCKLPSWTTGGLYAGTIPPSLRMELYNCDSADTNYRLWIEDYNGSIKQETTIKRTGGASDGTTGISWKMVTSANSLYPTNVLRSQDIVKWNETTGSSLTATVEIVHDSQGSGTSSAFKDNEIWLEVVYLGTSGTPLGIPLTDAPATILTTAADQTSSSETWTTTGLTTPVKQKLTVTFTAQEKGFVSARVCLAKASATAYVCPKMTVA